MTRSARFWAVASVVGVLGFVAWGDVAANGQTAAPPPPPPPPAQPPPQPSGPPQASPALEPLIRRMADEVDNLAGAIVKDLGGSARGVPLRDEARELAQALGEFRGSVSDQNGRSQALRDYSGIDGSWHRLLNQLAQPGSTSADIDRAAQQVARTDVMIHHVIGLNDYPAGYHGGTQPLSGMVELQRLTHALVDRAEALAAVVRADVSGPGGARLARDAVNLAQAADTFHDALDLNGKIDGNTPRGFAGVEALSDRFHADLTQVAPSPRVQNAWRAFRSTEVLVRRSLGLPNAPEDLAGTFLMETPGGGSPVATLADQLVQQVAEFVQVFSATAGAVPEGGLFLGDARALEAAAVDFRRDAARALAPNQLAFEFRDVDAVWQRLARRTNRIAQGRTGPNIQQLGKVGQTIAEIHRLLAVPGYAPAIQALPTRAN